MFSEQGGMRMPFEAVLMDMDGVIIDTQQSIVAFWQQHASEYHLHFSQEDIDQHISGRSARHTITTLLPHLDEQRQQAIYRALHDYEASLQYQEVSGAIALLNELKHHHIPIALVTGAGRWKVGVVTRQLGLEPFLAAQVTGDDVQKSKPDPDSYLLAAHRLGKEPQSCLVFEDAINGVLAAVAAQTMCIGVQTTAPACSLIAAGACCTIPDFTSVRVRVASSAANEADALYLTIADRDFNLPLKSSS
jgi:HAD superfamily hydrolase (TIGR01509 family)